MSELKITPGKWRIRPAIINGRVQPNYIESEDGAIICQFWTGRDGDARLLENAKSMYEYLTIIQEALRQGIHKDAIGVITEQGINALLARIRGGEDAE